MHFISSEALLEMYFLQGTLKELARIYGTASLRLIKPSPQDEKWVGIDQAWVSTSLTDKQFIDHLKSTVSVGAATPFYFAVFRQYKRVEKITQASIYTPYRGSHGEWSRPYYRCDVYTEPGLGPEGLKVNGSKKITVGQPLYSQHEALIRLSALPNADVQYACPMIFGALDVWQPPDMNQVRLVSVKPSYPTYAKDGEKHHLCFRTENDVKPEFHSEEGIVAESDSFTSWLGSLQEASSKRLNAKELLTTLIAAGRLLDQESEPGNMNIDQVMRTAANECEKVWNSEDAGGHNLARRLTQVLTVIEVSPIFKS